jgi:iron complex transport system ATP-binding protein
MIHFKNVNIGYSFSLLTIEELSLEAGGIYALIGANGSGKTTLLNSIIGKTKLLSGELTLDAVNSKNISSRELAKKIAFVESRFDGVEFLSVREYVSLGRTPYTNAFGRLNSEDNAIIEKVLDLMNLTSFSDRSTLELSDGERQMASIARALAQETPIIILDEPTAFLDYGNRKKLIQTLTHISKLENKCILFSSHDIDLCLEEKLPLLLVDQQQKNITLYPANANKNELLSKGFNIEYKLD